jgi:hypothetical protein
VQQLYRRRAAVADPEPVPGVPSFAEHPAADRLHARDLLVDPFREALAEHLAEEAAARKAAEHEVEPLPAAA